MNREEREGREVNVLRLFYLFFAIFVASAVKKCFFAHASPLFDANMGPAFNLAIFTNKNKMICHSDSRLPARNNNNFAINYLSFYGYRTNL